MFYYRYKRKKISSNCNGTKNATTKSRIWAKYYSVKNLALNSETIMYSYSYTWERKNGMLSASLSTKKGIFCFFIQKSRIFFLYYFCVIIYERHSLTQITGRNFEVFHEHSKRGVVYFFMFIFFVFFFSILSAQIESTTFFRFFLHFWFFFSSSSFFSQFPSEYLIYGDFCVWSLLFVIKSGHLRLTWIHWAKQMLWATDVSSQWYYHNIKLMTAVVWRCFSFSLSYAYYIV